MLLIILSEFPSRNQQELSTKILIHQKFKVINRFFVWKLEIEKYFLPVPHTGLNTIQKSPILRRKLETSLITVGVGWGDSPHTQTMIFFLKFFFL